MSHYAFKNFRNGHEFQKFQNANIKPLVFLQQQSKDAKAAHSVAQTMEAKDVIAAMENDHIAIAIYFNPDNDKMITVCKSGSSDIEAITKNPQKYLRVTWHQIKSSRLKDLEFILNAQVKPAPTVLLPASYHMFSALHPPKPGANTALLSGTGAKSDDADSDDEGCCNCFGK